jgi:hypothetical protein
MVRAGHENIAAVCFEIDARPKTISASNCMLVNTAKKMESATTGAANNRIRELSSFVFKTGEAFFTAISWININHAEPTFLPCC